MDVCFIFLRQGLITPLWLVWNLVCRTDWPLTRWWLFCLSLWLHLWKRSLRSGNGKEQVVGLSLFPKWGWKVPAVGLSKDLKQRMKWPHASSCPQAVIVRSTRWSGTTCGTPGPTSRSTSGSTETVWCRSGGTGQNRCGSRWWRPGGRSTCIIGQVSVLASRALPSPKPQAPVESAQDNKAESFKDRPRPGWKEGVLLKNYVLGAH